ncbi:MAG: hypothetical protein ACFBWO_18625 [Paracoccaceae bacterium]
MLDAFFDPADAPPPASALGEAGRPRRLLPRGLSAPGVTLSEAPVAGLWRLEAASGRAGALAEALAALGRPAPGPACWTADAAGATLRLAPRVWWLVDERPGAPPTIARADASVVDLSHARTRLDLSGPDWRALVARLAALDVREGRAVAGTLATAPMHGVAATWCWRQDGAALWLPRLRARALFGVIVETAAQFGVEVV